jgi:hypothetical protein
MWGLGPYSPECVEVAFYEDRAEYVRLASCTHGAKNEQGGHLIYEYLPHQDPFGYRRL